MKKCTITFYNDEEDEYGQTTARQNAAGLFIAVHGETIAVDPKIIPYGSQVHIPALTALTPDRMGVFFAHDTGSAVKSKVSSIARGNDYPVIDVFVRVPRSKLFKMNDIYGETAEYEIV